jgi:hypothetical protein
MGLTHAPDPVLLQAGAGTAAQQSAIPRLYADYQNGGWTTTPGLPATTANSGMPGFYSQPSNAIPPATFDDLADVSSATPEAWPVGTWIYTGDGTKAYWDGTAWQEGLAPAQAATGAFAGTPGFWDPSGATAPANLAGMAGVTANPATAWLTGQHMVLGDNSHTYWNATAWTAGNAP